jgi:hypothetical protein
MLSSTPPLSKTVVCCLVAAISYKPRKQTSLVSVVGSVSFVFLLPPHPRPPYPFFVTLILKTALGCLFFSPANQHILPLLLQSHHFPMQPYANPQSQPLLLGPTSPFLASCSMSYPSLSFLHQLKYVRTSSLAHHNFVPFSISIRCPFRFLAERTRQPLCAL